MDQKRIQLLLILLFSQKFISAEKVTPKDGEDVPVSCDPNAKNIIFWFRALDRSNLEFLASFSSNGIKKSSVTGFDDKYKMADEKTLIIKSFNNENDSGIYGCASLYKGNELNFGPVTRVGETKTKAETPPAVLPTTQTIPTTRPCTCTKKPSSSMFCNPIILGSLAGGCGLLLLLLIIITLYCNKIRTRRCPHHYKRKPRMDALEKQMMTNRHI